MAPLPVVNVEKIGEAGSARSGRGGQIGAEPVVSRLGLGEHHIPRLRRFVEVLPEPIRDRFRGSVESGEAEARPMRAYAGARRHPLTRSPGDSLRPDFNGGVDAAAESQGCACGDRSSQRGTPG